MSPCIGFGGCPPSFFNRISQAGVSFKQRQAMVLTVLDRLSHTPVRNTTRQRRSSGTSIGRHQRSPCPHPKERADETTTCAPRTLRTVSTLLSSAYTDTQSADQKRGRVFRCPFAGRCTASQSECRRRRNRGEVPVHTGRGRSRRGRLRYEHVSPGTPCLRFSSNVALVDMKHCLKTAGVDNTRGDQHTTSDLNFGSRVCTLQTDCPRRLIRGDKQT